MRHVLAILARALALALSQALLARSAIRERDAALRVLAEMGAGSDECVETLRICNETYRRLREHRTMWAGRTR